MKERCQTPLEDLHTVALRPPMDLLYIAGSLEQEGVQCKIIDFLPMTRLGGVRKNCVSFSLMRWCSPLPRPPRAGHDRRTKAKEWNPDIVTVTKGAHFIHLDRQSLDEFPNLDVIMRGEYEETVQELAQGKKWDEITGITWRRDGIPIRNPERPYIQNIDVIPFPARHLIDHSPYFRPDTGEMQATIVTSRGCPFPCVFCLAQPVAGKAARNRSPENVIAEIRQCVDTGIKSFLFRSDLFTANKAWVKKLCKAIQDENLDINWSCNSRVDTITEEMLVEMKKAGCWLVSFGVESGDPYMLEKMKKLVKFETIEPAIRLCRKAGVKSSVYFLIGLPWENRETFENTKRFARKLDPDFIEFSILIHFTAPNIMKLL